MKMEGDIICIHCGILKPSPVVDSGDKTCNEKKMVKSHAKLKLDNDTSVDKSALVFI